MMLSDKAKKALLELGLSSYEVKVYSSLVSYGKLTAMELSKISKVPYNKIYEVLLSLEKKGFIRVEERRPAKYYPVEPKIALEKLRKDIEERIKSNIEFALSDLSSIFEKKGVREKSDVWLIRGKDDIMNKLKDVIAKCKFELFVSVPKITETLFPLNIIIASLRVKDVKIFALVSNELSNDLIRMFKEVANVRIAGKMFGGGVISDSKEVLLLLPEEGETTAIWSDHIGLASFAKSYFMYIWEISNPA